MSTIDLYIPHAFMPYSELTLNYYFLSAGILTFMAIVLGNCATKSAYSIEEDEEFNRQVNALKVKFDTLGNHVETLNGFLEALDTRIYDLQKRVVQDEAILDGMRESIAEQNASLQGQAEDNSFACEIASASYIPLNPYITFIEPLLINYLTKSPATKRDILNYLMENKKLLNMRFFSQGGSLTVKTVNSCLYYLLHQKRLKKTDTTPPVWSLN